MEMLLYAILIIVLIHLFMFLYATYGQGKKATSPLPSADRGLQMQAYERLLVLAERIYIPALISRLNTAGMNAREAQTVLTQAVKEEFEYNVSQQLYVSATAWQAMQNLKEQNIFLINNVAGNYIQTADANFTKKLVEVYVSQQEDSLHKMVQQILVSESKKGS